jgi:hypothetical protein
MATEARYNKAKEEWLDAAKAARDHMEDSKKKHKEEKDVGITSDSWEKWFPQNVSRWILVPLSMLAN